MTEHAQHRFTSLIERFVQRRVLVLGDMVADEYIVGRPARISREAPVLVLYHAETFVRPGGATNTANNIRTLGAETSVAGLIGDDSMGTELSAALKTIGIRTEGLLVDRERPTSTKTRILGRGVQEVQQQIVRIDRIDDRPMSPETVERVVDAVCRGLEWCDLFVISDYENGLISQDVLDVCLPRAIRLERKIVVDSHSDLFRFKGVSAATPNQPEAEAMLGRSIESELDLDEAGDRLLEGMDADAVLITRGSQGISLFERGRDRYDLPISTASASDAVDPAGAGDTVAAVFALSLASGADLRDAAYLANIAGGEVVRRWGVATLTPTDLVKSLERTHLAPP